MRKTGIYEVLEDIRSIQSQGDSRNTQSFANACFIILTSKASLDHENIVSVRIFGMKALVYREVLVLETEYLLAMNVGEN